MRLAILKKVAGRWLVDSDSNYLFDDLGDAVQIAIADLKVTNMPLALAFKLHFDSRPDIQEEALVEAGKLLEKAGVTFDMAHGVDGHDWFLDWSLKGATIDC